MSDDNILKKYEQTQSFVATEDDLKSLVGASTQQTATAVVKNSSTTEPTADSNPIAFEKKDAVEPPNSDNELVTDYQYIRTNLYTITERSIDALNNLVQIADQSQHPRAYEVVALLVNTIANAQKDLLGIHTSRAKIDALKSKTAAKSPDVINNNLFVGNTAQLDEIIKNMNKKKDDSEQ
jgi:Terminase DNA packaging enzyme